MATFTVEVLDYESDTGEQTWVIAARRGPKMDNGWAVGLSLEEAESIVEILERTGSLARVVADNV